MATQIPINREALAEFCRQHHIARLSLFGSILRSEFDADSDIDVLVEFEPGKTPGLAYFRLGESLAELFGRRVDYGQPEELHPRIRDQVLSEAEVLYEA